MLMSQIIEIAVYSAAVLLMRSKIKLYSSEAKASVPRVSNKVGEWVIEYVMFLHGLAQQ